MDDTRAEALEAGPGPAEPARRAVLTGSAVALVAGVGGFAAFSAFGTRNDPSRTGGPATGYDPGGGTAGTGTAGAVLAPLADVPTDGGVVLTGPKVVVTRGSGEDVHAFSAVCTHQGCLVSEVRDGLITCPCHGSAFHASSGDVAVGPATAPLPPVAVSVSDGSVVAAS